MNALETTRFLHERIPVTHAMGFTVVEVSHGRLVVHAPLASNPNPHGTVFGGTLSTLGLVSGWSMLHVAMTEAGVPGRLVGQHSESAFLAPGTDDCVATAEVAAADLDAFLDACRRRERARIAVPSLTRCGTTDVARHRNVFVALPEN